MTWIIASVSLNVAAAALNAWVMFRNERISRGNEQILQLQTETLRTLETLRSIQRIRGGGS